MTAPVQSLAILREQLRLISVNLPSDFVRRVSLAGDLDHQRIENDRKYHTYRMIGQLIHPIGTIRLADRVRRWRILDSS